MAHPRKTTIKRGGFGRFVGFRIVPFLLCLAALTIGMFKAIPGKVAGIAAVMPPDIGRALLGLADLNWLVVIIISALAIIIAFVGSLIGGRQEEEVSPASAWRDGVKIDRTKCAKSSCRRMRFAGKLLCPECWTEWNNQKPLRCAECGDETLNQQTTNPLCKLCHQRWLDT